MTYRLSALAPRALASALNEMGNWRIWRFCNRLMGLMAVVRGLIDTSMHLNILRIDPKTSIFDLRSHSFLAFRVRRKLRCELRYDLPIRIALWGRPRVHGKQSKSRKPTDCRVATLFVVFTVFLPAKVV